MTVHQPEVDLASLEEEAVHQPEVDLVNLEEVTVHEREVDDIVKYLDSERGFYRKGRKK